MAVSNTLLRVPVLTENLSTTSRTMAVIPTVTRLARRLTRGAPATCYGVATAASRAKPASARVKASRSHSRGFQPVQAARS